MEDWKSFLLFFQHRKAQLSYVQKVFVLAFNPSNGGSVPPALNETHRRKAAAHRNPHNPTQVEGSQPAAPKWAPRESGLWPQWQRYNRKTSLFPINPWDARWYKVPTIRNWKAWPAFQTLTYITPFYTTRRPRALKRILLQNLLVTKIVFK